MFTGLIETVGTIKELRTRGDYRILSVAGTFANDNPAPGESIACDGACLTVVSTDKGVFEVEASQETAKRTILSSYTAGSRINLERALKVGGRLGGHFVSGHVDDTDVVDYVRPIGQSLELAVRFDPHFDKLVIDKGSIAINGVSLTVNACRPGWFNVNLIPFTVKETTLGLLQGSHRVNLEFDMIGKYVLKIQENRTNNALTREKLIESGW
jgi:riboflavin synthase